MKVKQHTIIIKFNLSVMWGLIFIIVLAVASAGLAWAFYNFEQLKKISLGNPFSVD